MKTKTSVKLGPSAQAKLAAARAIRAAKRANIKGERRTNATIMREDAKLIRPGAKKAPGTRVVKYARQSAAPPGDFKTDSAIRDAYALTLLNPMANVGAKLPDQWATPSTAKHIEYELTVSPVQDGAGYYYVGLYITDSIGGGYATLSSVSGGVFTWGALQSDPQYTILSSYIDRYRLVSAMLRLENGTSAANLQGRAYTVQSTTTGSVLAPGKVSDLTASGTRVRSFQLNDIEVTPCARYLPFINNATASTSGSGQNPAEWNSMADTSPNTGLAIICQISGTTGADFVFRAYKNWEFVPLLGAQYVIPTSMEVAMPEDAVSARRTLLKHEETWEGDLESAVRDTARLAKTVAKTAGSLGKVASNIWGGLTSAWSGLTARRQALQAAHGMLCQVTDNDPELVSLRKQLHVAFCDARSKELRSLRRPNIWDEEKELDSPRSVVSVKPVRTQR